MSKLSVKPAGAASTGSLHKAPVNHSWTKHKDHVATGMHSYGRDEPSRSVLLRIKFDNLV